MNLITFDEFASNSDNPEYEVSLQYFGSMENPKIVVVFIILVWEATYWGKIPGPHGIGMPLQASRLQGYVRTRPELRRLLWFEVLLSLLSALS